MDQKKPALTPCSRLNPTLDTAHGLFAALLAFYFHSAGLSGTGLGYCKERPAYIAVLKIF